METAIAVNGLNGSSRMHKDLREKIKQATEESGIEKPDFVELLSLIDAHYDKMEATITQSLTTTTPIEAIFDSVAEAQPLPRVSHAIFAPCDSIP